MVTPKDIAHRKEPKAMSGPQPFPTGQLEVIPIVTISPSPLNPRSAFPDAGLAELAASIREHGVLQPILVRLAGGLATPYSLLAGERRWRAAKLAGLATIPARVVRAESDAAALAVMLTENLQREDLDAMSASDAIARLVALKRQEQTAIAASLGKSQPWLANMLRLQRLPDAVKEKIRDGTLSAAHGRALVRFADDPARCERIALVALQQDLTSKDLEAYEPARPTKATGEATPAADAGAKGGEKSALRRPVPGPASVTWQPGEGLAAIERFAQDPIPRDPLEERLAVPKEAHPRPAPSTLAGLGAWREEIVKDGMPRVRPSCHDGTLTVANEGASLLLEALMDPSVPGSREALDTILRRRNLAAASAHFQREPEP